VEELAWFVFIVAIVGITWVAMVIYVWSKGRPQALEGRAAHDGSGRLGGEGDSTQ
jgi:hypothetical protein